MPYPVVSDERLELRRGLGLPTFQVEGLTLYKRLPAVAARGGNPQGFSPRFPPPPHPARLRRALADEVPFTTLELVHEAASRDGTVKALFRTHDGHPVEAVLMRYRDGRRSVCLSSQSGCPLTCTFCATG